MLLLCLFAISCAEVINFKDCGSVQGKVHSVEVIPCRHEPCFIRTGDDYTIQVSFTSLVQSQTSKAKAYAMLSFGPRRIQIPEPDGCKSGIKCPIEVGNPLLYKATLNVPSIFPYAKGEVKWRLRDDSKKNLFCIEFPVEINSRINSRIRKAGLKSEDHPKGSLVCSVEP